MRANQSNITKHRLAFSLKELADLTSLSQNFFRNEIKFGNLRAKKFGARVLVLYQDWEKYAEAREDWQPLNK